MTDSDRLVVRSWVGSETGGYDHERFAQQMRGLPYGYVEVRVAGSEAEIDSPVPIIVVSEDGTETELAAGQHRATIR
jgi:hypothetical protein